jgi:Zn-dependent protease
MFKRWRIGSLLGFPVEVNWTFLALLAVMFIWYGGLIGVFLVLVAFASVLLHELGHAVVARQLGVRVSGIELSFFGGAAKMVELPRSANHEIAIAAAGPAVSLMLAGAGFGLGAVTGVFFFTLLGWINVVIAAFNLLPALPMDGGRILRALLTRKFHYVKATDLSVQIARYFAVGFVALALYLGSFQLLILAPMLWFMGTQERMIARVMADRYAYDGAGYTARGHGDVEVMGRGRHGGRPHEPFWADARYDEPPQATARPRRVVIRQRNGRLVLEVE